MSQQNSSGPIPTAILVTPPKQPANPPPRLKDSLAFAVAPWTQTIIAGSVAFMGLLLVVALYFIMRPETQRLDAEVRNVPPPLPGERANLGPKEVLADDKKPAAAPEGDVPDNFGPLPIRPDELVECARIGTDVQFMKDPVAAFKRAREERKMVFMMHLSGNLEDKDFT